MMVSKDVEINGADVVVGVVSERRNTTIIKILLLLPNILTGCKFDKRGRKSSPQNGKAFGSNTFHKTVAHRRIKSLSISINRHALHPAFDNVEWIGNRVCYERRAQGGAKHHRKPIEIRSVWSKPTTVA